MSKEELYNIVFDTPELKEYVENKDKEIEKLQNIIKEVREFVEEWKYKDGDGSVYFDINTNPDDLLGILDKVGDEK